MSDIAAILRDRKPRTASKAIVFDGELLGQIEQLRQQLQMAKAMEARNYTGLDSKVPSMEAELMLLSEQAADEAVTFTVKAIRADELDELKRQAPPDKDDLDRYREQVKHNPFVPMPEFHVRTLAPMLLAAATVDPPMDLDQAQELWSGSDEGQQSSLWSLVWGVQQQSADLPFSVTATASTDGGGLQSTTPANTDSLSPSI